MNSNQIKFKQQIIQPEELSELFKMSQIRRPFEDLKRLEKMIHQADILITAWDQDYLVGIARAITDFSYCCYLSDLAVHKDYQKQGIGRRLIELVREGISEEVTLLLLASPTAMDYYPHIGFTKIENGYLIPQSR
jgi:GNAT superfamily N-acetyltransferase